MPAIAGRPAPLPERLVARVLVSGVNAASLRAVNYATTLGLEDTRAVNFAFSRRRTRRRMPPRVVVAQGPRLPLEVDEAPYRDIGDPLLGYLREHHRRGGARPCS